MAARAKLVRGLGIGGETAEETRFAIANRPVDARAEAVVSADREHESLRARTREVLEDATQQDYGNDQVDEIVQDLLEVRTRARDSTWAAVEVGRLLRRIQERVGPKGYKGLLQAGLAWVPENMASAYRRVAEAVDGGRIPQERLPAAFRPAYDLARLEPPVLELVAERIQLGPATTAKQIKEAVAAVRAETPVPAAPADAPPTPRPDVPDDPEALKKRIGQLEGEIERLGQRREDELQRVRWKYGPKIEAAQHQLKELKRALNPRRRARGRAAP